MLLTERIITDYDYNMICFHKTFPDKKGTIFGCPEAALDYKVSQNLS